MARETSYQRSVKKILKSPQVRVIEGEFGGQPELIYAFRVVASFLAAEVRSRGGRWKRFELPELAVPWAVAHNQRLARDGLSVTTLRSPWLKKLEQAGLIKILGPAAGGFLRVDFEPLAAKVQPLLDRVPQDAPKHVAAMVEEQNRRNRRVEEAAERSAAIPPLMFRGN